MGGEGRKWAGAWAHLPPLAGRPLRVGTGLGHSPPLHLTALILGDRGMHIRPPETWFTSTLGASSQGCREGLAQRHGAFWSQAGGEGA